ncbi:hypothetical protein [Hymenobacter rubripertinctus]|uniref:Uncharacterized protein n=1 Tax=Hymenobacter rubripertinctus TaxID=2029981 RepID=A0A418QIX0_9BACT|nr:hypothetical protein [Hymenobacter rubripertinctus]RIY05102.1 hypothetical protein D0T11_20995 [Hymenobacter rubripertinctus]
MIFTDLLNATTHSLSNGLTGIPLSAAQDNTETWQLHLLQSGEPRLQDIGREMGNLQSLLSAGDAGLNSPAIGRSLSMLGTQTAEAAQHAPAEVRANLTTLSDLLLKAGGQLAGPA